MGLDMYLTAKRYLWSESDKEISAKVNDALGIPSDPNQRFNAGSMVVKQICLDAMYWRKANAIHGWFVENCQGGVDDCQEVYVSRTKLTELRDLCKDILEHPNKKGLEPRQGFFFGTYDKDQYYFDDLKATVEGITKALELPEDEYDFYYQASW